jgi:hypothetical protein
MEKRIVPLAGVSVRLLRVNLLLKGKTLQDGGVSLRNAACIEVFEEVTHR